MTAKLKGAIKLICSGCGKEQDYDRSIDDVPNNVKTIISECPECNCGDFCEERWFDVVGREINQETRQPDEKAW